MRVDRRATTEENLTAPSLLKYWSPYSSCNYQSLMQHDEAWWSLTIPSGLLERRGFWGSKVVTRLVSRIEGRLTTPPPFPRPHTIHTLSRSTPIEIVHAVNPAPYRDRRTFCGPWLTNNKGQFRPASNFPSVRLLHTAIVPYAAVQLANMETISNPTTQGGINENDSIELWLKSHSNADTFDSATDSETLLPTAPALDVAPLPRLLNVGWPMQ